MQVLINREYAAGLVKAILSPLYISSITPCYFAVGNSPDANVPGVVYVGMMTASGNAGAPLDFVDIHGNAQVHPTVAAAVNPTQFPAAVQYWTDDDGLLSFMGFEVVYVAAP